MKRNPCGFAAAGPLLLALAASPPAFAQKQGGTLTIGHFDSPASISLLEESTNAVNRPMMGLFNNLVTSEGKGDALDLKKGGIFPIVHGIRSLAIEHGLLETATDKRIARLCEIGVLQADFTRELSQTLGFLLTLRLDGQLAASGGSSGTLVRPSLLSSMERDLLRDAFQVVKRFRGIIRHHFNLGMF